MKLVKSLKKILSVFALILAIFPSFFPSSVGAQTLIEQLEKTALPAIQIPKIDRMKLDSGMRLLLQQNHEVPVVRGYIYIATGEVYEPQDKLGVADLTGLMLRSGGTRTMSPQAFDEKLASMGAEISSSMDRDYGIVAFKCLREDFPKVLAMVFEMLKEPSFDVQRLDLKKQQLMDALKRENDDPADIAKREFPKLVYGADNVWGRSPTSGSIQALNREDVQSFYQQFYYPQRMVMALSGDFNIDQSKSQLNQLTRNWPKTLSELPTLQPMDQHWESGLYFIPKKIDQATIFVGHYGEKRFNPDKYALLLLNEILGGDTLTSRLGKKIRSSLGLAYAINSRYGLQNDYGIFFVAAQTEAKNTNRVLQEIRKQLEELLKPGNISEAEMNYYKNSLLSSLYSQYEPAYNFAKDEAKFDYYGYEPNYLELLREKLQAVTVADLQRVAQKYIRPGVLKILVVGDAEKVGALPGAKILEIEKD